MKFGYSIPRPFYPDTLPGIIECCNFKQQNSVCFYYWYREIFGGTKNTIAIFKIKPKANQ